ncbi:tetratricopeptide repeat protein [Catellatospora chokoriensis]|uniref:Tetratricopeptide repeat protein n=1 Tax=Catellatospora chokoriensis TaxID=310353 RepID=A0A8J3K528_9ACTN|nr:tetratricopeptide repeat protein [Catellatospora chokoriensis]GIF90423.1 hypothetical protein Cch02nite_38670 [Catellatospora chokoriensis]
MTTPQPGGYDADTYFAQAMERARAGESDSAAELLQKGSDRGHGPSAFLLGAWFKDAGRLGEAEVQYRRALSSQGLSTEMVAASELSLGYIRARTGDDAGAEQYYRSAERHGNPDATFNLANVLNRTGRAAEAEAAYRRAVLAGHPDAAFNLADILVERGEAEAAEPLLRQAAVGGITDAYNALAKIRLGFDDVAGAENLLRTAVAAGDDDAVFNLGIVLLVRGALDEAEHWLRQAQAAGHPEASQYLEQIRTTRMS